MTSKLTKIETNGDPVSSEKTNQDTPVSPAGPDIILGRGPRLTKAALNVNAKPKTSVYKELTRAQLNMISKNAIRKKRDDQKRSEELQAKFTESMEFFFHQVGLASSGGKDKNERAKNCAHALALFDTIGALKFARQDGNAEIIGKEFMDSYVQYFHEDGSHDDRFEKLKRFVPLFQGFDSGNEFWSITMRENCKLALTNFEKWIDEDEGMVNKKAKEDLLKRMKTWGLETSTKYIENMLRRKTRDFEEKSMNQGSKPQDWEKFAKEWRLRFSTFREYINAEYLDPVKAEKLTKEAKGEIEYLLFILCSGSWRVEDVFSRFQCAETLRLQIMAISNSEFDHAKGLLEQLKGLVNKDKQEHQCTYAKMGPPKNVLGTFKKATRKVLGREKDTPWQLLNFVKKAVKFDALYFDIKDIIRGTLIFKSFDLLKEGFLKIGDHLKTMKDKGYDIIKVSNGFNGDVSATYRDMKIVVILPLKEANKERVKDLLFPGVAFEIQFNTMRGAIVKSAHVDAKVGEIKDASGKVILETNYKKKETKTFMASKFVDDCEKALVESDVKSTAVISEAREVLNEQYEYACYDDHEEEEEDFFRKEISKIKEEDKKNRLEIITAHQSYKLEPSKEKDKAEKAYAKIYRLAYLADGFLAEDYEQNSENFRTEFTNLKTQADSNKAAIIKAFEAKK